MVPIVWFRRFLSHEISLSDSSLALRITGLFEGHLPSSGAYPLGALGKALRAAVLATSPFGEALPGEKLEAKMTVSGRHKTSWLESLCNNLPRHKTATTNQANAINAVESMLVVT